MLIAIKNEPNTMHSTSPAASGSATQRIPITIVKSEMIMLSHLTFFRNVFTESIFPPLTALLYQNIIKLLINYALYCAKNHKVPVYQRAHIFKTILMKYAKENNISADLFMAVESGIVNMYGNWMIANFAVVCDKNGHQSIGMSASFPVPEKHVDNIIKNTLGTVMDELFNESDLRSSTGGIGLLTQDHMTRIDLNTQAFTMALTKFVNGKTWSNEKDDVASL